MLDAVSLFILTILVYVTNSISLYVRILNVYFHLFVVSAKNLTRNLSAHGDSNLQPEPCKNTSRLHSYPKPLIQTVIIHLVALRFTPLSL